MMDTKFKSEGSEVKVAALNPLITCVLCGGYLLDATAITECLHAFCRSCIVSYLELSNYCPVCDVRVHDISPTLGIRRDKVLQSLVYKLVPGLFSGELKRQADYYTRHPHHWTETGNPKHLFEECWEIIADDELISLSLEFQDRADIDNGYVRKLRYSVNVIPKRYLLCPAKFRIKHLKKFVRAKLSLTTKHMIEVYHTDELLADDLTLMDVIYIYSWQKLAPFRLYYTVYEAITISSASASSMTSSDQFKTPSVDISAVSPIASPKKTHMTSSTKLSSMSSSMATPLRSRDSSKEFSKMSGKSRYSVSSSLDTRSSASNKTPSPVKQHQYYRNALSPIYPLQEYMTSSVSDDSDSSDPTFRLDRLYVSKKNQKKRTKRRKRAPKRPHGMADVEFYPRHTSTPKCDEEHTVSCRFSPGYVPVYKRAKYDVLNVAMLGKPKANTPHNPVDVYNFESQSTYTHQTPIKRKRGRPRKYPLPHVSQSIPMRPMVLAKRGPGRPRKYFKSHPNGIKMPTVVQCQRTERPNGHSTNCVNFHSTTVKLLSNFRTTVSSEPSTHNLSWIPTSNPSWFIPSIPVSLNLRGIDLVKTETKTTHESSSSSDESISDSNQSDYSSDCASSTSHVSDDDSDATNRKIKLHLSTSHSFVSTSHTSSDDENVTPDTKPDITRLREAIKVNQSMTNLFNDSLDQKPITSELQPSPTNSVICNTVSSPEASSIVTLRSNVSKTRDINANKVDQSSATDFAIKQEVEETHPNLRDIIEGRLSRKRNGGDSSLQPRVFLNRVNIRTSLEKRFRLGTAEEKRNKNGALPRFQALNGTLH